MKNIPITIDKHIYKSIYAVLFLIMAKRRDECVQGNRTFGKFLRNLCSEQKTLVRMQEKLNKKV